MGKSVVTFQLEKHSLVIFKFSKVTYITIKLYIIITYLTQLFSVYNGASKSKTDTDVCIVFFLQKKKKIS